MTSEEIEAGYRALRDQYREAQDADPLRADSYLPAALPRCNAAGDRRAILEMLARLHAATPPVETLTAAEAWAAIRDLGFVIGAARRLGSQPALELAGLDATLRSLAQRSGSLHPRDNVFTLTVANPPGERTRTYTGAPSERAFIEAVGASTIAMDRCVVELWHMAEQPLHSPRFAELAGRALNAFKTVTEELLGVRKKVDPAWFALEFVRNLESIEIGGRLHNGPSADQSPMLLVDWMLHGASNPGFGAIFNALRHHLRPFHHQVAADYDARHGLSIVETIRRDLTAALSADAAQTERSITAVIALLHAIRTFRYPHRKIAINSFALRSAEHQVGSGGMTPDRDLHRFVEWTEAAIRACENCLDKEGAAHRNSVIR